MDFTVMNFHFNLFRRLNATNQPFGQVYAHKPCGVTRLAWKANEFVRVPLVDD